MRYAVSDVHGHRDVLVTALTRTGLLSDDARWAGGDSSLFVLGDMLDRGPDGIGTIDLVMRLEKQAAQAGGRVVTLLGNHEILALGVRRFRSQELGRPDRARSFALAWMRNGGIRRDQEAMTVEHEEWLVTRPAAILDGDDLLVHSDTAEYLRWGDSVAQVNATVRDALDSEDAERWWDCWRWLTDRYAFLGSDGLANAGRLLSTLGGRRVVHGHSLIGDLRHMLSEHVTQAWRYADGLALAIDGGIYDGGPCLVVPLDDPVR
jgi:Calcineurin-like phosphoesterase